MSNKLIPNIPYKTVGDTVLMLDIVVPDPMPAAPVPIIVEIHGGGWMSGGRNGEGVRSYGDHGYVCASIQYRLTSVAPHPAQIDDCRDAVRWMRTHAAEYGGDPTRIGITGGSAGGHLTALLGASGDAFTPDGGVSCAVNAVVDLCGPADITVDDRYVVEDGLEIYEAFLGGPVAERLDAAREASAISYVDRDLPAFLIMHCADDPIVPVRHTVSFGEALKAAGADVEMIIFPEGGHGFEGHWGSGPDSIETKTFNFFDAKLHHRK